MSIHDTLYTLVWYLVAPIRILILCIRSPSVDTLTDCVSVNIFGKLVLVLLLAYGFIYLVLLAYVRITHPVWSRLPAFHIYHLLRGWWWYPPGILSFEYTSKEHTKVPPYSDWLQDDYIRYRVIPGETLCQTPTLLRDVLSFLSTQYSLLHDEMAYTPKKERFCAEVSHRDSRIGLVYGERLAHTRGFRPLLGVLTFSPLRVRYRHIQHHEPSPATVPWNALRVMYIDNLCIARGERGKGYFSKLCYTSIVRMMKDKETRTYPIHLFKREGTYRDNQGWRPLGVIPAWQTVAYGTTLERFHLYFREYPSSFPRLPRSYRIQHATIHQVQQIFRELQKKTTSPKALLVAPEYASLSAMLGTSLWVHVLMDEFDHTPLAMYAWRLTDTTIKDTNTPSRILELISSVWLGNSLTHPLFLSGFRESVGTCAQELERKERPKEDTHHTNASPHPTSTKLYLYDCSDTFSIVEEGQAHSLHSSFSHVSRVSPSIPSTLFTDTCPITWTWLGFAVPTIPKNQIVVLV